MWGEVRHGEMSSVTSNEPLLLAARGGVRQAVAVLAHVARSVALYMMRCSRAQRYAALLAPVRTLRFCTVYVHLKDEPPRV